MSDVLPPSKRAMTYEELSELCDQQNLALQELRKILGVQRQSMSTLKDQLILVSNRAMYDELTGLYRRGEFEEQARVILENHGKIRRGYHVEGQEIYMVLLDIRHFKQINDSGGQKKGDIALQNAAQAIRERMSKTDLYCRFGGDEFGALLIGIAEHQVERIVEEINRNLLLIDARISFRFGVAKFVHGESYDELCQRADDALYEKKRQEKGSK